LRDTLSKAIEKNPIFSDTPDREPMARESTGKFAKQTKPLFEPGAEVPNEQPEGQPADLAPDQPQEEQHAEQEERPAKSPSTDQAPKSWKAATRGDWEHIPPGARAEIHRREREVTRAIGESTNARKFGQAFQEAVAPFVGRYRQSGATPVQVVKNLMEADTFLATAPADQRATFMAKLIKDYGIDIRMLDTALTGGDLSEEPTAIVEQMISKQLQPLQSFVQSEQQRREQQQQNEYNSQQQKLQSMADDKERFPHFDMVLGEMADIMELGVKRKLYLSPEEAYKRAVAMNPEAQAAEQGQEAQRRNLRSNDAANRSLGASLSVNGSPAGLRKQVSPTDLRGTIEAAWAAAQGR
jgi:hypothetical protein